MACNYYCTQNSFKKLRTTIRNRIRNQRCIFLALLCLCASFSAGSDLEDFRRNISTEMRFVSLKAFYQEMILLKCQAVLSGY